MKANGLIQSGLRLNTVRTYNSAQQSFIKFCSLFHLQPLPATELVLLRYIAYMSDNLKGSSLNVYISAIKSLHILNGHDCTSLSSPRIQLALKGISDNDPPICQKEPISFHMLQTILPLLPGDYDTLVVWSAMTLAFFGCLRAGEITIPSRHSPEWDFIVRLSDVQFYSLPNNEYMKVSIKRTKTKPHGIVVTVGCSQSQVCALCTMKSYFKARGIISTIGNNAPLYVLANGQVLHKDLFVQKTKIYVAAIGKNPSKYSGHSFRSGAATTASSQGFHEYEIKQLGHWSSQAYQRYIHPSQTQLSTVASRLAAPLIN